MILPRNLNFEWGAIRFMKKKNCRRPSRYFLVFLIFTRCFRCIVMQYNRNPACRDVLPSKNFPRDDHLVPLPKIPPTPIKMVQWLFFVCFFSLNCLIHWDFRVWQALFWPSLSLARRALLAMLIKVGGLANNASLVSITSQQWIYNHKYPKNFDDNLSLSKILLAKVISDFGRPKMKES